MAWRKPPEENVRLLDDLMPQGPAPVDYRPMFGCACYWTGGNMVAFVHQDDLVVRLPEGQRAEILAMPGAHVFEPMGRPMREYVALPSTMLADREAVRGWLERALAYTATLPPKQPKRRKQKRA